MASKADAARVKIAIPYTPRPQQRAIHELLKRRRQVVAVCHRRMGKTVAAINHIIRATFECPHPRPRYAYIAPLYSQAKRLAWDYMKHYTAPINEVRPVKVVETELRIDLPWGARIELLGAESPDKLRGAYLDGVVLDEFAQIAPSVWSQVIRPALVDRQGWALIMGTPKGKNAFYDLWQRAGDDPHWGRVMFKASETGIIPQEELDIARREMSEAEYLQEFECSFAAAIVGAYYAELLDEADREGRICSLPYDHTQPVYTAWDLGIRDATAIWFFQRAGTEIHCIDYEESSDLSVEKWLLKLQAKGYVYAGDILPHDAQAREKGTGLSIREFMQRSGRKVTIAPRLRLDDGIEAVRRILPSVYFDAERCRRGIEALRSYRREWNEKNGIFKSSPVHDWSSHAADAFRTLATGIQLASYDPSGILKFGTDGAMQWAVAGEGAWMI